MASLRRPFQTLFVLALLVLSACSNTPPAALQVDAPEDTAAAADESAAVDSMSTTLPETIAMVDDASEEIPLAEGSPAANGSLPRTTAEGIALSAGPIDFDYGDGPVASFEVNAEHRDGSTGLFLPIDQLKADAAVFDVISWAGSGGTYVLLAETGPSVAVVRLTSSAGGLDRTAPNSSGLAVLAVRAEDLPSLRIEALDDSGTVVATCADDGDFLRCS